MQRGRVRQRLGEQRDRAAVAACMTTASHSQAEDGSSHPLVAATHACDMAKHATARIGHGDHAPRPDKPRHMFAHEF
jgi:hypothetical protein